MHFPVFACVEDAEISSFLKGQKRYFTQKQAAIELGGSLWLLGYYSIPVVKN